jgi:DNA-binding NarL/FixJ family response regulator
MGKINHSKKEVKMNPKTKVKKNSEDKEEKPKKPGFRKYSTKLKEHIADLIRQGKTMEQILEEVEPRKKTILRIAKRYNLEVKK